ncbi:ATP synthase F1 subunit gamma [Nitratiruptor sp. SB155-2]|uniref:ATP synthase gamma chain n=1 Tax=Nitratiruptor sp. (strain SB155-2) TaxID=387092 RepID=ATPG_NITSB|nr:ATP synthase F1 subunit gamma [Nitratiruptor sp. SB155-2]A6Q4C1.1 RecName: Full=ATP synthase gamma chain; AltName: Full=ATP synthase F1 sector gamma subunit; AltName: Full=F-ATPase gamma subunit [Nitratiruptor sp. SB155-2]BAF70330.1 F0F1-type ATP synthase, gamma subunit [Nitratiruptor sp. SB155-2]
MANLKDIKRKIGSVKNTQKTTRAMKLVSTAKLRRTEELAKRTKYFEDAINATLRQIASSIKKYKVGGIKGRYFEEPEAVAVVDIIFITADKGLCGGFNYQTIKTVRSLLEEYQSKGAKVRLRAVGKKGIEFFNFQGYELNDSVVGLSSSPNYEEAKNYILKSVGDFLEGKTDKVILIHNGYKNMITQEMKAIQLLPIDISKYTEEVDGSMLEMEPDESEKVLESLLNKYIEFNMYYALIDSLAAEHSARMQAMDAATNNAKEMVRSLTISYNKARQESITTELIEIISGMEAMK